MPRRETILLVDALTADAQSAREALRLDGREIHLAPTAREALNVLHDTQPDLVLLSLELSDLPGPHALDVFRERTNGVPIIAIAAHAHLAGAVEAMRRGAVDYLSRPIHPRQLVEAVYRALQEARSTRELERVQQQVKDRYGFSHMLTRSPRMLAVFDQVRAVAGTDATVLIRGETGTGKELISRAIHERSRRKDQTFISVNCGAFTESLLESELFGHERGSFTGASGRRRGVFEMADGGTLFLDELGETSLNVQVNLLRVLDEMEFRRVGGHERVRVDVRIVAATNVALEEAIHQGRFREDLYYRLNVFPIFLPPLRERKVDIPLLMRHFLEDAAHEYKLEPPSITTEALDVIMAYAWPGNVRQLRSLCERWVITHNRQRLQKEALPREMTGLGPAATEIDSFHIDVAQPMSHATERLLHQVERSYLHRALQQNKGHLEATAQTAGITRRTLYTKMKKYGLEASTYRQK
jgi:two-component system response regulator AtoC